MLLKLPRIVTDVKDVTLRKQLCEIPSTLYVTVDHVTSSGITIELNDLSQP